MKIVFATYDNQSAHNPLPLGACYVASYIRKQGYDDVSFYSQDVYHYPDSHLTSYIDAVKPDVVSIGFVAGYYQHAKVKAMVDAIRAAKYKTFIVLGGHGPSPVPEFYLQYSGADAVVVGEAEVPFVNMLRCLEAGALHGSRDELAGARGVVFRDGDAIVTNPRASPIKDIDTIPFPSYDLLPMEYYINGKMLNIGGIDRQIAMITSRGCPFKCNFCVRLEKGIRFRSPGNVAIELKTLIDRYKLTYLLFYDEYFAATRKRVREITEAIRSIDRPIKYFCTGRLDMVDEDILGMLRDSGCVSIDYGIEQYDDDALAAMDKHLTTREIQDGIELTRASGIAVAFNIIYGNIGDTKDTLRKSINFLHKYNDYSQLRVIRPVTPYPGSPLYHYALEKGLLTGPEDFYRRHTNLERLTVNFTPYTDDEVHQQLYDVNCEIIDKYYEHQKDTAKNQFRKVYFEGDSGYRGARHNI